MSPLVGVTSQAFTAVWNHRHLEEDDPMEGHQVALCWVSIPTWLFSLSISHWELGTLFLPTVRQSQHLDFEGLGGEGLRYQMKENLMNHLLPSFCQ